MDHIKVATSLGKLAAIYKYALEHPTEAKKKGLSTKTKLLLGGLGLGGLGLGAYMLADHLNSSSSDSSGGSLDNSNSMYEQSIFNRDSSNSNSSMSNIDSILKQEVSNSNSKEILNTPGVNKPFSYIPEVKSNLLPKELFDLFFRESSFKKEHPLNKYKELISRESNIGGDSSYFRKIIERYKQDMENWKQSPEGYAWENIGIAKPNNSSIIPGTLK